MYANIAAEEDPNGAIADQVERGLLEALRQNVPNKEPRPAEHRTGSVEAA
jgi:hypothetical protein